MGDFLQTVGFDAFRKQYFISYLGPVRETLGERKTKVYLEYDSGREARTSSMKNNGNFFTMTLYTKYAPHAGNGSKGLSTGTVLLIILFCILVVYFGIGMAFMKYHRGARGKQIIPHYSLWSQIPGLAKDGCSYTSKMIQECGLSTRTKVAQRRGYEEI